MDIIFVIDNGLIKNRLNKLEKKPIKIIVE